MKLYTLAAVLLFQIPLYAQTGLDAASNALISQRTMQSRGLPSRFDLEIEQKEKSLARLVARFGQANERAKEVLRKDVEQLLYKIFDLKIQAQEDDIRTINREVKAIQASNEYQHKAEDIARLKLTLQEVTNKLASRKQNRDKIVNKKLIETIDG